MYRGKDRLLSVKTSSHGGARKGVADRIAWRCIFFWAAPLSFLALFAASAAASDAGRPEAMSGVLTFFVLLGVSLLGLGADCSCNCNMRLMVFQFSAQVLVILGQFVALGQSDPLSRFLDSAPIEREPTGVVAPMTQAPVEATGMSIVLPCLNETYYVVRTVQRFCERTPPELLREIIVVDDGSTPPLAEQLEGTINSSCRLKVVRHDRPWGLMIAKQSGGDASMGRYIGFFDCHVAPAVGWHTEIIELLEASPRRLVVPMIADLDLNTYDERHGGATAAKCYINFDADFWWYEDDSDFIPIISGGLVATTREWWLASGGFDPGMRGWGGENTDQSLRAWLCGGDVVRAKTSRIAHMWRVNSDQRTVSRYKFKGQTNNQARVAAIWFDEYKKKYKNRGVPPGIDVSATLEVKARMKCKPFVHFLHRFRKIYIDGGVLPDAVFRIRSHDSKKCISRSGDHFILFDCHSASWFHLANLVPKGFPEVEDVESRATVDMGVVAGGVSCGAHRAASCAACPDGHGAGWCHRDCTWSFGACIPAKALKLGQESRTCCSGIREWNSMDCFDSLDSSGVLAYHCDVMGSNLNQQYFFDRLGRIRHSSGKCLGPGSNDKLVPVACEGASTWYREGTFVPIETTLYKSGVQRYKLTDDMPNK